ncbi:hypothetical protein [Actinoplanes aureus]|uniref:Uncharacterized protein n=1 Tax=Actinoplanes aureus TaxID=2792083 RepID=A0A931CHV3_9ACTN|nr:hypothetical protein [Actinoplanes aureus]MBG0567892.1 hypothetical protein [Actinoplanes aureus]
MTDQIEELFADLRAGTLPTVRPPGTEPLRRAVRRRRAVLSGAAAVAVLAVAGLVAVIRPDQNTVPAVTPASEAPTYSVETLQARVAEALGISDPQQPGLGEIITNTGSGPKQSNRALLGGTYEVRMVCYGSGSMAVSVLSGNVGTDPVAQVVTVPCDATSTTVLTVPVVMARSSGTLMVQIEPEVAGPGRAAFGWQAQLAQSDEAWWEQQAQNALGADPAGMRTRAAFFMEDGGQGEGHTTAEPQNYQVRAVCVGFGTATLTIGPDGDLDTVVKKATLQCSPRDPKPVSLSYPSRKTVHMAIEPDDDAEGRSAAAYLTVRG